MNISSTVTVTPDSELCHIIVATIQIESDKHRFYISIICIVCFPGKYSTVNKSMNISSAATPDSEQCHNHCMGHVVLQTPFPGLRL